MHEHIKYTYNNVKRNRYVSVAARRFFFGCYCCFCCWCCYCSLAKRISGMKWKWNHFNTGEHMKCSASKRTHRRMSQQTNHPNQPTNELKPKTNEWNETNETYRQPNECALCIYVWHGMVSLYAHDVNMSANHADMRMVFFSVSAR